MSFTTAALLVSWLAIVVLALGLAGLLRQVQDLTRQVASLGSGVSTTSLVGLALPAAGPIGSLRPVGGGLVVVISPGCTSCAEALDVIAAHGLLDRTVAVSASTCEASGVQRCVPDAGDLIDRLGVPATPYLIAVDAAGEIVATELPAGPDDVAVFLAATRLATPTPGPSGRPGAKEHTRDQS